MGILQAQHVAETGDTRWIHRCLSESARENPTVANFATVGFKWCEANPLRKRNRDVSKTEHPERSGR